MRLALVVVDDVSIAPESGNAAAQFSAWGTSGLTQLRLRCVGTEPAFPQLLRVTR